MGSRLADEIKMYVKNYLDETKIIINLVGHSMGGIIARAALKHLGSFQNQFGFYCSLGTPHLGYLNGVDGLIKVGLWALRKWKTIKSL
jgi:triacylglycerol esterase/lipase EstA (alpha/beta hydrolase family)